MNLGAPAQASKCVTPTLCQKTLNLLTGSDQKGKAWQGICHNNDD
jgi:hypothetical protein